MLLRKAPRGPYNYDGDVVSDATVVLFEKASLTQQQFAEEVDINTLVRRYHLSGEFPVNARRPTFGDFSDVHDFQSAMNAIALAHEAFDAMPAETRAEFNNDPQKFLEFTSNAENLPRMRQMGLAVPEEPRPEVVATSPAPVDGTVPT